MNSCSVATTFYSCVLKFVRLIYRFVRRNICRRVGSDRCRYVKLRLKSAWRTFVIEFSSTTFETEYDHGNPLEGDVKSELAPERLQLPSHEDAEGENNGT